MGGSTVEHSFPRWYQIAGVGTRDPTDFIGLCNSQRYVVDGRFDTFESPQGTDYQVPAGKTLYIIFLAGTLDKTTQHSLRIGYGDDGVANSASAPTNAVDVAVFALALITGGPQERALWVKIPAGKYPWLRVDGEQWNYYAVGILV